MARYWTSDLHLGHPLVATLRGFGTVEAHDKEILEQIAALAPTDHLWILGDISSGRPEHEQAALAALADMRVLMHLIAGNHDSVSGTNRTAYKRQRQWLTVFESVQQFGVVRLGGKRVLMSHYPYAHAGDGPGRGPERFTEYRLTDVGRLLLHGHTHQDREHVTGTRGHARMYSVGWDAHRHLVPERHLTDWAMSTTEDLQGDKD